MLKNRYCSAFSMVGFGSTLRMARRSGWEGGYLDYETLKLLLSQIEAVYEEEAHRASDEYVFDLEARSHNKRRYSRQILRDSTTIQHDYREELFLESDSDAAFGSVDDDDDRSTRSGEDIVSADETPGTVPRSFSLNYSLEGITSDEEEEDKIEPGCGGGVTATLSVLAKSRPWSSNKKSDQKTLDSVPESYSETPIHPSRRKSKRHNRDDDDDNFAFVQQDQQTFSFLATDGNSSGTLDAMGTTARTSSYSNIQSSYYSSETTSLLPPTTPVPRGSTLYSLSDKLTPPTASIQRNIQRRQREIDAAMSTQQMNTSFPPLLPSLTGNNRQRVAERARKQLEKERSRARQRRRERRRKRRRLREARERKVPRHIRLAHAKARAITERFLGLLRAETEKVMMFAQSRLGELADTAGSLRFPSFEEDHFQAHQKVEIRGTMGAYDYPLSDGGMHPSGSSSEDGLMNDASGPVGMSPWSDSENDDDEKILGGNREADQRATSSIRVSIDAARSMMSSVRTPKVGSSSRKTSVTVPISMVRRKISRFQDIRNSRPVFQRNDHILGEDMLFLSAVEEADGYTAVAVELLHLLRYICVNLIAVRKICRKHDRLLMNRMLGGYYHRARGPGGGSGRTLGGMMALSSNDVFEAHPALVGQINHFKLVGIYDTKIQNIANSRTVQVVSSCLASALSEYEVARTRADTWTKQNSSTINTPQQPRYRHASMEEDHSLEHLGLDSDDDNEGPPSTASTMSLTRLRFAVSSVFSIREAARFKLRHFDAFLSRSSLVFTGQQVVGEGLDGCSRSTLDFVLSLEPDSVLLHDPRILYEGLQEGKWSTRWASKVMTSTLAAATIPENGAFTRKPDFPFSKEEYTVLNAVSVMPNNKDSLNRFVKEYALMTTDPSMVPEIGSSALQLNCLSCFLFMVNYFVAHPTSIAFLESIDTAPANSALLIGAPNLSAMICAVVHCMYISEAISAHRFPRENVVMLKGLFAFAAFMGVFGNILTAVAVGRGSFLLALLGRFAVGFASTEIMSRQLLCVCVPALLVRESARLTACRVAGVSVGLFLGSLASSLQVTFHRGGVEPFRVISYMLAVLWSVHFWKICRQFKTSSVPESSKNKRDFSRNDMLEESGAVGDDNMGEADSSKDSDSASPSILQQLSSDESSVDSENPLRAAFAAADSRIDVPGPTDYDEGSGRNLQDRIHRFSLLVTAKSALLAFQKLLATNIGVPVTLMIIAFSAFGLEILFSATPIVVSRYFGCTGSTGGWFLCFMATMVLPIQYVTCRASQRLEERSVIKVCIISIHKLP